MARKLLIFLLFLSATLSAQITADQARQFAAKPRIEYPDSIDLYAGYFHENDDLANWLTLYNNTARVCYYEKKQPDKAGGYFQTGRRPWRTPAVEKEWSAQASLHMNAGYFYRKTDHLSEASECYSTALDIYRSGRAPQNDLTLAMHVLKPLANVCAMTRDYDRAEQYFTETEKIYIDAGDIPATAAACNDHGMMYISRGEYAVAAGIFQKGLNCDTMSPDTRVLLMLNLGLAQIRLNQIDLAEDICRKTQVYLETQAAVFSEDKMQEHLAELHENYGAICRQKHDWNGAVHHFQLFTGLLAQNAGPGRNRELAKARVSFADLYLVMNQPDSALVQAQQALRSMLPRANLSGNTNPVAADLYRDHTVYSAFRRKTDALNALMSLRPGDSALPALLLETCDLLFLMDEIMRRGYDFEESRLSRQDASRQYFDMTLAAAFRLQSLGRDPALAARAWQYAELARARLLLEQVQERELAATAPADTRRQLNDLELQINELQISRYEGALNRDNPERFDKPLFEKHEVWKKLLKSMGNDHQETIEVPRTDLTELQRSLGAESALIEYVTATEAIYAFVLRRDGLQFLKLPRPANILQTAGQLRNALLSENLREFDEDLPLFCQTAGELYDALLSKALETLPQQITRLYIVPDEWLYQIPFELLGRSFGQPGFKTFPYLLRRYAVGYAHSGNLLLKQLEKSRAPEPPGMEPFIGFAPIYYPDDTLNERVAPSRRLQTRGGSYDDLPASRREVKAIADMMGGTAYLAAEAGESRFKTRAAQARILHLAMHAWIDDQDPRFSQLLFTLKTDDHQEDNNLYALELQNMALYAQLITLSACETGLGKMREGEGVMSLARACAVAGVPAALISLWEVEDSSTNTLMVEFYRQFKTGVRKDQALQQAKLTYLKNCDPQRSSPFFWAGFVMYGCMDPIWKP